MCDWITPLPADTLLARGMMGDGHIDFAALHPCVAAAGYTGDVEVEIFNADVWADPAPRSPPARLGASRRTSAPDRARPEVGAPVHGISRPGDSDSMSSSAPTSNSFCSSSSVIRRP